MTTPTVTARDWRRSAVAGMASYLDSSAIVSTGTALVLFTGELGLDPAAIGLYSGLLTLAIAAGAMSGGRLGDRFGRRVVFSTTMVMIAVGAGLLALATGPTMLLIGVLLLGYGSGADLPVSLALIAEEAPPGAAGRLVGLSQVLWFVGIIVTQLLTIVVGESGALGGRLLYLHIVVVAIAVLLLRLTLPESTRWAASRQALRQGGTPDGEARPGVLSLLRGTHLKPIVGLILFYSLVNVAANTIGQFGTFLFSEVAGASVRTASIISTITVLLGISVAVFFMRVVDTRHRMHWYTVGAVAYVLSVVIPLTFGVTLVTLILSSVLGAIGASLAFEAMLKIWSQELFPTLMRATAQGTVIGVARVLAAAAAFVTPTLLTSPNPSAFYAVLTGMVVVGLFFGYLVGYAARHRNHLATSAEDERDAVLTSPQQPEQS